MKIDKSNIDKYINGNTLYCSSRDITSIENIPDHITEIYCYGNQLTSLPMLPDSLIYLNCYNNNLTSYPVNSEDKQWFINHNNHLKLINRSTIINKLNETR